MKVVVARGTAVVKVSAEKEKRRPDMAGAGESGGSLPILKTQHKSDQISTENVRSERARGAVWWLYKAVHERNQARS